MPCTTHQFRGLGRMVQAPDFQSGYVGSIPTARSKQKAPIKGLFYVSAVRALGEVLLQNHPVVGQHVGLAGKPAHQDFSSGGFHGDARQDVCAAIYRAAGVVRVIF